MKAGVAFSFYYAFHLIIFIVSSILFSNIAPMVFSNTDTRCTLLKLGMFQGTRQLVLM